MSRAGLARRTILVCASLLAMLLGSTGRAAATEGRPWWQLSVTPAPTQLPSEGEAQFVVTATNVGDVPVIATSKPVTIGFELPAGVAFEELGQDFATRGAVANSSETPELTGCEEAPLAGGRTDVSCKFAGVLPPFVGLLMRIVAKVERPAEAEPSSVLRVQGGTAEAGELVKPLHFGGEAEPFSLEELELKPEEEGGGRDTQAGSHPFQLTTTVNFDETLQYYQTSGETGVYPTEETPPRELRFKLPPGLVGSVTAVPTCSSSDFDTRTAEETVNLCPADTAIGVASLLINDPQPAGFTKWSVPVFNLAPEKGEPARFGFLLDGVSVVLKTVVPTGGEYGVEVRVSEISQVVQLLSSQLTLWGAPADSRHDSARGFDCLGQGTWYGEAPHSGCQQSETAHPPAFLTLPTSCSSAAQTSVEGESWPAGVAHPGLPLGGQTSSSFPIEGCSLLGFQPALTVQPEATTASTPSGLSVGVSLPQEGLTSDSGRADAAVKDTTVTLPAGLQLSPPAANGLQACSAPAFGSPFSGSEEGLQTGNTVFLPNQPGCPEAAKVGTVEIKTPLLGQPLQGSVYLAEQDVNPFRAPLVLYLVAEDPAAGVLVKLAGSVVPNPTTGQLVSTFENTPKLPFEELRLHFFGGPRASTATPAFCGTYTTTSDFTPWSGGAEATPSASFAIDAGAGGGPCPGDNLGFAPETQAGSNKAQAGAFTSFALDLARPDGQQALTGLSVHLPPGIAAVIADVTPCPEPAAGQEWSCGPASQIGEAVESSGLGGEPVVLHGTVYLTSGYDGAPFGLLVRTLAAAGPFNLGYVNVRSRIDVDPHSGAVSVTTDPGPRGEAIPTILDGVPVQLKSLQVTIDERTAEGRPFEFNPTSCAEQTITGTLTGSEGAAAPIDQPFAATGCSSLPFSPKLTASTQGQASRVDGASLTVRVTSSPGQANIAKTVLTLPKTLPSRQSTIKLACVDAVFEANPSSCPEGSNIGTATVHTPIFKNPLTGPAYLVSHGGAAFPDVEFVLQGEGVTLILDGQTKITKGITTSSFESVPDDPVESFEAVLPEGPHSALGAYLPDGSYDLCSTKLTMPTTITGQNGVVIDQNTSIAITGCSGVASYKSSKPTRAQRLKKALASCRKRFKHAASRRRACEASARKTYGTAARRRKKP